jgi:hypothetical protein
MLEGVDNEWQNAGTRRRAFHTGLPPTGYHFRVIACNNDGVWNETGANLSFALEPGVLLKFHALTYLLDRPAEARTGLESTMETARQAINEGRDAVQGLRSSALFGNDLAQAISTFGEEVVPHAPDAHPTDQGCPEFCVQAIGASRETRTHSSRRSLPNRGCGRA